MLAQRPLMPIQRPTSQAATAVAAGALVLGALYSLAQSCNIQFKHAGGLQHLLVSLPGLLEGLIMWVIFHLGPGSGFQLVDGLGGSQQPPIGPPPAWQCPPSAQAAPQGRQDVLDGLFPSVGACPAVTQVTFLVNTPHGKGP